MKPFYDDALIIQGDALRLPLADASVDLVVTSPPYLWKRKYAIRGTGELGNERDWRAYLDNLYTVTDEMLRVLKPSGSIWVNLGDTRVAGREPKWLGIPPKSRLLLPERYRVGCQDRYTSQGAIVRQVQVWNKPNGLPEGNAFDRTQDDHEDFLHLTKQPKYYSALNEVREPLSEWSQKALANNWTRRTDAKVDVSRNDSNAINSSGTRRGDSINPLGALPGSVWSIPSEPLRLPDHLGVQHYAAMPSEWPRRLILGWCPPGGVVLDPFGGTGTTAMVARALGRIGISLDLSRDYCRAARWRVYHDGAKATSRTNLERQGLLL